MIRMIAGVYGLYKDGKVTGMDKDSGPFEIDPAREAELVAKGLAEYVVEDDAPIGFDETPPEETEGEEPEKPLEEMTAKELREVGAEYGLTFKANASKQSMIEAIKAEWPVETEGEDEELPEFDPSEAVE